MIRSQSDIRMDLRNVHVATSCCDGKRCVVWDVDGQVGLSASHIGHLQQLMTLVPSDLSIGCSCDSFLSASLRQAPRVGLLVDVDVDLPVFACACYRYISVWAMDGKHTASWYGRAGRVVGVMPVSESMVPIRKTMSEGAFLPLHAALCGPCTRSNDGQKNEECYHSAAEGACASHWVVTMQILSRWPIR